MLELWQTESSYRKTSPSPSVRPLTVRATEEGPLQFTPDGKLHPLFFLSFKGLELCVKSVMV